MAESGVTDLFEKIKQRTVRMHARLAKCPQLDIEGVVRPGGGAMQSPAGNNLWTVSFPVNPWTGPDGKIINLELLVEKDMLENQADRFFDSLTEYSVVKLRVKYSEDAQDPKQPNEYEQHLALMVKKYRTDGQDTRLLKIAEDLKKPVKKKDPILGSLTLNRFLNWWEGSVRWSKKKIALHLSIEDPAAEEEVFKTAYQLAEHQKEWMDRASDFAVNNLLQLKNESWLEDDEKEVTPAGFKKKLKPRAIGINPGGHFEISFDDGWMFGGHLIVVSCTLSGGPERASLEG